MHRCADQKKNKFTSSKKTFSMSEAGGVVHNEATAGGFQENGGGKGFQGRRGKFMKPTFASMRAAVPTLASTKAVTEKLVQKGE